MLSQSSKSERVDEMYRSCGELFARAQMAVENFALVRGSWERRASSVQGQSSGGERESVEDFLTRMEFISAGYDVDLLGESPRGVEREFV